MDEVSAIVERLWPGSRPSSSGSAAGSRTTTSRSRSARRRSSCGSSARTRSCSGSTAVHEHEATLVARRVGVGPEVVAFVGRVPRDPVRRRRGRPPEELDPSVVAETLRLVHSGPAIPGRFDSFRVVEEYRADRGGPRRRDSRGLRPKRLGAPRRSRPRAAAPLVPCHNDLLNANFIDDGRGSGSSTGSTRAWATRSSTSATSRRTTSSARRRARTARGVLRGRGEAALSGCTHALHVGLPRGDVGSGPAGDLGAGLRLRRLRATSTSSARALARSRGLDGRGRVVIGGGVGGCSILYWLDAARLGRRRPLRAGGPDERLDVPLGGARRPAARLAQPDADDDELGRPLPHARRRGRARHRLARGRLAAARLAPRSGWRSSAARPAGRRRSGCRSS